MLRDGDITIADSEFIKRYLIEKKSIDFDAHLSKKEAAQAHAFATMIDERTYWTLVYDRWIDDKYWPTTSNHWFGDMPFPLRIIIPIVARKGVRANLKGHGIGLHSAEDIHALAASDFNALSAQLGDQNFLFGDKPCSADATAFGLLVNLVYGKLPGTLNQTIKSYPNLVAYAERGLALWFPQIAAPAAIAAE